MSMLHRGIELFNQAEFFECHEVLEVEWTPERGPRRLFLQSLIHMAVGWYHVECGNRLGAERQFRKGLRKLAAYLPVCEGVDTARLHREATKALAHVECGEPPERMQIHLAQEESCSNGSPKKHAV
jgi:predicted metal-dependent hydrolase